MTGNKKIRFLTLILLIQALLLSGCEDKDDLRYLRDRYDYVLGYRDYNPGPGKSPISGDDLLYTQGSTPAEPAPVSDTGSEYNEPENYEEEGYAQEGEYYEAEEEPVTVAEAEAGETGGQEAQSESSDANAPQSEPELGADPSIEADSGAPVQEGNSSGSTENTQQTGNTTQDSGSTPPQSDSSGQTPTPTPAAAEGNEDDEEDGDIVETKKFGLRDTWTVPGAFSVTINSVISTPIRNEDDDTNPAVVYLVDYTYRNEGYSDPDGLLIDVSDEIYDSAGQEGDWYDLDVGDYEPREIMPGESCDAQVNIALYNDGPFDLVVGDYDNNDDYHEATFHITP